jgi:4-methyl-5(b-hydroxyethyl)-thiazole monophosphate biosynthesis
MSAPTVLIILAEGFEEVEAIAPLDLLRRAGAEVTMAALAEGIHVTGRGGLTVHADTTLTAAQGVRFDCIVLPGGPGTSRLRADSRIAGLLATQQEAGLWIAAICAAPVVLKDAGLLVGKRYTAHHSVAAELPDSLKDERVVVDGRLITSRGAGTAIDFGIALVGELFGPGKADEVSQSVYA